MKTLFNVLWAITFGIMCALSYFIHGILLCITIIGIPFGVQFFKIAKFVMWPFGKTVTVRADEHPYLNILFGGQSAALAALIISAIFSITVIGIPFGKQFFKLSKLFFAPFGATVEEK